MDEPRATEEVSKQIFAINKEAIHHLCSGQVVLDLTAAVKELVENSLDSGATCIEIKLVDYGKTCITVIDNGSGVAEKDFKGLGLKHHTSKLKDFSDLLEVQTFGFRGEALSSLCYLSNVNIITRHSTSEHAFDLSFNKNGDLVSKKECARQQGTTIHVRNIFKNLPVRARELESNIKKEYSKMIQVLHSYCLVSTGIKIICSNSKGNKPANIILSTNGFKNVLDNISAIFGRKTKENLIEIKVLNPDKFILDEYNLPSNVILNFTWECYVSSCCHTMGRSTPDRQFFYVNNRPCDFSKINKLINQLYHQYNNKQYPFIYLNIHLNKNCTDINVTPDKRTIFLTQEQIIFATIKSNFLRVWKDMQGKFTVKPLEAWNSTLNKKSITDLPTNSLLFKKPLLHELKSFGNSSQSTKDNIKVKLHTLQSNINKPNLVIKNLLKNKSIISTETYKTNSKEMGFKILKGENFSFTSLDKKKIIRKKTDLVMLVNLEIIRIKLTKLKKIQEIKNNKENKIKYKTELNSKAIDVEKELERELTKESFSKMQIIGQFNLGFLLTKLDDDIFIIDQHASDEKFRFEKLLNETKLKTQKLIFSRSLNLTSLNEAILIENLHVFKDNGFTFEIKVEENPGNRVKLTGIPVSFGWQFGQEDIEELIFLINEGECDVTGCKIIPRPSRVQQMLASRACRNAIMIGKALNSSEMRKLVTQMSQMKNPWNCPHGRPTLRHLITLTYFKK